MKWQQKLHNDMISKAIAARKMKDDGSTTGDIMNHFGVSETCVRRWFKFLEEEIPEGSAGNAS